MVLTTLLLITGDIAQGWIVKITAVDSIVAGDSDEHGSNFTCLSSYVNVFSYYFLGFGARGPG